MTVIKRFKEEKRWKRTGPWRLVYGRRKVGKSFFVKNQTDWDEYYFVTKSRTIIKNGEEFLEHKEFLREFRLLLGKEQIVVDEFHRLPAEFLDFLHMHGPKGELTLITSSKFFARSMLNERSPLLGLVTPYEMSLISPVDILRNLKPRSKEDAERAFLVQEPWTIPMIRLKPEEILANAIKSVPGLLGEIATEEDKQLTETYDSILEAIAIGENTAGKIASYLSGKFPERSSKVYTSYLKVLEDLGIIQRLRIHARKRSVYVHTSPIVETYYRIRRRSGYPEIPLKEGEVLELCRKEIPHIAETFVRNLFAEILGETPSIYIGKHEGKIVEIDGYFERSKMAIEVKWRGNIGKKLIRNVYDKLKHFKSMRKILVMPVAEICEYRGIEIVSIEDLVEMAAQHKSIGGIGE